MLLTERYHFKNEKTSQATEWEKIFTVHVSYIGLDMYIDNQGNSNFFHNEIQLHPSECPIVKMIDQTKHGWGAEQRHLIWPWGCKWYTQVGKSFFNSYTYASYGAIRLSIYSRKKVLLWEDLHMCAHSSFTVRAPNWKLETTQILTGKWMNKVWHIHTMKHKNTKRHKETSEGEGNVHCADRPKPMVL